MQHLCVLLWGLFVSCHCVSIDSFIVSQFPSTLTVTVGERVQITCSWNISIANAKVKWYKDERTFSFNLTDKLVHSESGESNVTMVINNADENDAGFYTCEVTQDIPRLMKSKGSGTNVTYWEEPELVSTIGPVSTFSPSTERPTSTTTTTASPAPPHVLWPAEEVDNNAPVIFAIRCVPFVTLLLAVYFLSRKEKNNVPRAGPRTEEEQDIIIEEEEMEKEKEEQEKEPKEQTPGHERTEDKRDEQPERVETESEVMVEDKEVKESGSGEGMNE